MIEKRGKSNSVGFVFSQAAECQVIKPDPNQITTQFDKDEDDEPVSIFIIMLTIIVFMLGGWPSRLVPIWQSPRQDQIQNPRTCREKIIYVDCL